MPARITVQFNEAQDSPKESLDADGFTAVMSFICAWDDRIQLAIDLTGGASYVNGKTIRTDPFQYPYANGGQVMGSAGGGESFGTAPVVDSVKITPLHGGKQSTYTGPSAIINADNSPAFASYEKAEVMATFRVPTWQKFYNPKSTTSPPEWITEEIEPSAEFLTVPSQRLYWDAGHTVPVMTEEGQGLVIKMLEWTRIRHKVIQIHGDALALVGCVNNDVVKSDRFGFVFPAETLLYTPPRVEPVVFPDGTKAFDWVMKFMYRPAGWNYFFRAGYTTDPDAGGDGSVQFRWSRIYDAAGHVIKMYKPADFTNLLWN